MRKQDLRFENFYRLNWDSDLYFLTLYRKDGKMYDFFAGKKGLRLKFIGFGTEFWHDDLALSYSSARKHGYHFPVFLDDEGSRFSLTESCKCLSLDKTSTDRVCSEMSELDQTLLDLNNRLSHSEMILAANNSSINDYKITIQKLQSKNSNLELKIASLREQIIKLTS